VFSCRALVSNEQVKLTGILYSDNPSAIVDGEIVKEGDMINGAKVIKIHRDKVEFEKDGEKWTKRVY
jgi:type II secretory pathway component PulC